MMDDPDHDPAAAALARRNRRLGLLLGLVVLGGMALWMALFTRDGLPKDPEVWRRMQEGRAAEPGGAP